MSIAAFGGGWTPIVGNGMTAHDCGDPPIIGTGNVYKMLTFAKFWSVLQMRPAVIKPQENERDEGKYQHTNGRRIAPGCIASCAGSSRGKNRRRLLRELQGRRRSRTLTYSTTIVPWLDMEVTAFFPVMPSSAARMPRNSSLSACGTTPPFLPSPASQTIPM